MQRLLLSVALVATVAGTPSIAAAEASTAQLLSERGLAAGARYPGLANLCSLDGGQTSQRRREMTPEERAARRAASAMEPVQVFDNLYYVGSRGVGGWVIETSDGLILIDAMNNNEEAQTYIEAGLRKLGLDPADLRYLIVTHAHGDHYGGQEYLVETYAPRVVMSEADWAELEKPVQEFSSPRWGEPPQRDLSVRDGETLTLGDTSIQLYVTPGHTPGTLSLIFPVYDGDATHKVALWGGTGMRFGEDEARFVTYAASAARMHALAQAANVDIFMSNHPSRDNALENMERLAARAAGEPHPFVTGADARAAFDLLRDCALAKAEILREKR